MTRASLDKQDRATEIGRLASRSVEWRNPTGGIVALNHEIRSA